MKQPEPSSVSIKSDWSMATPIYFQDGHPDIDKRFLKLIKIVKPCLSIRSLPVCAIEMHRSADCILILVLLPAVILHRRNKKGVSPLRCCVCLLAMNSSFTSIIIISQHADRMDQDLMLIIVL